MSAEKVFPDDKTIRDAISGDQQAVEKLLSHYADVIDSYATVEVHNQDGTTRQYVDPDLRQHLVMKLLEELPSFPVDEAK